ncbi:MAG: hypothetical protein OXU83_05045 [Gammaproteobacteria bacterium]|nr:hypothetical protein [Gammaproteobacteria bacterium]
MTGVFLTVLLSHLLLAASGLALMQLAAPGRRLHWLPCLPYAWPTGVVVLYAVGYLFVLAGWWSTHWNYAAIAVMLLLAAAGAVLWLRAPPPPAVAMPVIKPRDWVLFALLAAKCAAVVYAALNYPVIDSDATNPAGYVSLAKRLGEGAVFPGGGTVSPLGPSILAAWARMPLDRWYDSMIAVPWLFAWLSFIAIAAAACYRLTRHTTASLACAWLFASLPLVAHHALRPGFNDLLVACFFIAVVGVLCFFYLDKGKPARFWLVVAGACLVCGALSKMEGRMWLLLLSVMGASYWLYAGGQYPWRKILLFQLAAAAVVYLLYWLTADFIAQYASGRVVWLFQKRYNSESFFHFFSALFSYGSFNVFWWLFVPMALFALIGRVEMSARALVIYMLAVVFALFYFSNFTGNVQFTLIGTNVSRFFLQVSGIMLPVYCIFARQVLEIMSRPAAAGR